MQRSIGVCLLLLLISGCAVTPRLSRRPAFLPEIGYQERGMASWYGRDFQGRKTSSGETFDMFALTAAHRTLPLGTIIRVRNERTGRQVEVRVNDRGPFISGRILDLSYTAAKTIGMLATGTAPVILEVVRLDLLKRAGGASPFYTIQIGSFKVLENASRFRSLLEERHHLKGTIQVYETNRQTLYRVRVGRFSSEEEAKKTVKVLSDTERIMPFVTRAD